MSNFKRNRLTDEEKQDIFSHSDDESVYESESDQSDSGKEYLPHKLLDCEGEENGAHLNLAGNEHHSPPKYAGPAVNLVGCEGKEIEEDGPRSWRSCHFTLSEIDFNDTLSGK